MGDAGGQLVPTRNVRWLIGVLLAEVLAGFVFLTRAGWVGSATSWWATTLQFVGALVTFLGLLWAYVRARTGLGLWEMLDGGWSRAIRWWDWARGRKRHVIIRPAPMKMTLTMGTPRVTVVFARLQRDWPIEDQLEQLADAIRNVQKRFKPIYADIGRLRQEIEELRSLAESSAQQTIQHIEHKVKKLNADLARGQRLDLKWAIGGLLISTVGTVLQYWA